MNIKCRVSTVAKKEAGIFAWLCICVVAEVTAILILQIAALLGLT